MKINSNVIANHCSSHINKEEVDIYCEHLISSIDQLLRNLAIISLKIDLDILGRIIRKGN